MKRRVLMGLIGSAAAAPQALAQRTFHLAAMTPTLPLDPNAPPAKFLVASLAQHDYRLDQNPTYESLGSARRPRPFR